MGVSVRVGSSVIVGDTEGSSVISGEIVGSPVISGVGSGVGVISGSSEIYCVVFISIGATGLLSSPSTTIPNVNVCPGSISELPSTITFPSETLPVTFQILLNVTFSKKSISSDHEVTLYSVVLVSSIVPCVLLFHVEFCSYVISKGYASYSPWVLASARSSRQGRNPINIEVASVALNSLIHLFFP